MVAPRYLTMLAITSLGLSGCAASLQDLHYSVVNKTRAEYSWYSKTLSAIAGIVVLTMRTVTSLATTMQRRARDALCLRYHLPVTGVPSTNAAKVKSKFKTGTADISVVSRRRRHRLSVVPRRTDWSPSSGHQQRWLWCLLLAYGLLVRVRRRRRVDRWCHTRDSSLVCQPIEFGSDSSAACVSSQCYGRQHDRVSASRTGFDWSSRRFDTHNCQV